MEKWPIELFSRLLPRIYQIVEEINRRFILQIQAEFPGDNGKVARMAIVYDGQVKMAHLAIVAGYSVNGVARLHTEILKKEQLKDFYEMMPQKFNNKTNGITQRRFLLHANPLLADWITNEDNQAVRFAEREIGPSNINVAGSEEVSSNTAIAALSEQSAYGVVQIVGGKYWDPAKTFGEKVAQGQLKADDEAGIQAALDELVEGVSVPAE